MGSHRQRRTSPSLLGENHRRDRPKILTILDLVEPGLHVGVDRRGQDRSCPERPGTELHAPLEPAEDAPRGEHRGGLLRNIIQPAKGQLRPGQKRLDLGIR